LECGKFISGDIKYGKLKEVGLPNKTKETPNKKIVKIKVASGQIIEGEIVE